MQYITMGELLHLYDVSEVFKVGIKNHLIAFINFYQVKKCCRGFLCQIQSLISYLLFISLFINSFFFVYRFFFIYIFV